MTTTMPPTPPGPRELPPNRHAEIRAEIRAEVRAEIESAAARPGRRSWLFPVIAGAAAVVLVIATIVLLPNAQPESAPPASVREGPPDLPPGITLEERAAIERKCAPDSEHVLYNALTDEVGTVALLYDDSSILLCPYDYPERLTAHSGMGGEDPDGLRWLPGAVVVDRTAGAGGPAAYEMVAGRTRPEVGAVALTVDGETELAVLANDTFIARVLVQDLDYSPGGHLFVRAYDGDGHQIDVVNTAVPSSGECYVLPDGRFMVEGGAILPELPSDQFDTQRCPPAARWR